MDPRIENLETTTFLGKRLTRRQIAVMQETVALFPNDSRRELARTLCENFDWHTPSGSYREQFCLRVLERLESLGILTLPERRATGGRRGPPARTEAGEPGEPVDAPLRDLEPVGAPARGRPPAGSAAQPVPGVSMGPCQESGFPLPVAGGPPGRRRPMAFS